MWNQSTRYTRPLTATLSMKTGSKSQYTSIWMCPSPAWSWWTHTCTEICPHICAVCAQIPESCHPQLMRCAMGSRESALGSYIYLLSSIYSTWYVPVVIDYGSESEPLSTTSISMTNKLDTLYNYVVFPNTSTPFVCVESFGVKTNTQNRNWRMIFRGWRWYIDIKIHYSNRPLAFKYQTYWIVVNYC